MLNVGRVLDNPRFRQAFKVFRTQGQWVSGEFSKLPEKEISMAGVIVSMTTRETEMLPEQDRIKGGINIYTHQALYTTRLSVTDIEGYFSDEVFYKGERWKVISASNRSEHGFFKAKAVRKKGA